MTNHQSACHSWKEWARLAARCRDVTLSHGLYRRAGLLSWLLAERHPYNMTNDNAPFDGFSLATTRRAKVTEISHYRSFDRHVVDSSNTTNRQPACYRFVAISLAKTSRTVRFRDIALALGLYRRVSLFCYRVMNRATMRQRAARQRAVWRVFAGDVTTRW